MNRESSWKLRARMRNPEPRPDSEAFLRLGSKFSDDLDGARTALGFLQHTINRWLGRKTPWAALEGKQVLELASGSAIGGYPPWFSRLCSVFGAKVTAIDILSQDDKDKAMFNCVQADLIETVLGEGLDKLMELKDKKFDLIYASRFLGSNAAGEVINELKRRNITREKFEDMLKKQVKKLLARGGYMDVTDELSNI